MVVRSIKLNIWCLVTLQLGVITHSLPHHVAIAPAPISFQDDMKTEHSNSNGDATQLEFNPGQRSLFQDVVNSLRKRDDLSKNILDGHSNPTSSKLNEYQYFNDNDPVMIPGDIEFMSRRNDRHDFSLRGRNPKQFSYYRILEDKVKEDEEVEKPKSGEIIVSIDTQKFTTGTTGKPKKPVQSQKRPKPVVRDQVKSGQKNNQIRDDEDNVVEESEPTTQDDTTDQPQSPQSHKPQNNNMSGQSQIGNRESQMVIKPTVIVNFRGSVSNRDSNIGLEDRNGDVNTTLTPPQTIFNINQEVNIEKTYAILDENRDTVNHNLQRKQNSNKRQSIKETVRSTGVLVSDSARGPDLEQADADDMIMSETILDTSSTNSSSVDNKEKNGRQLDDSETIAILLTVQEKNGKKTPFIFNIGPLGGFLSVP